MQVTMEKNQLTSSIQDYSLERRVMLMAVQTFDASKATGFETGGRGTGEITSISGNTDKFFVDKGTPRPAGGNLDPRAEKGFASSQRLNVNNGDTANFTASYNVVAAKDTTIFQILNNDERVADKQRPVLFIEAETSGPADNRQVKLFNRSVDDNNDKPFYTGSAKFDFEVDITDSQATFGVVGENTLTQRFDRDRGTRGTQKGQFNQVRYGAYHHDRVKDRGADGKITGNKYKAASAANVIVSDARLQVTRG